MKRALGFAVLLLGLSCVACGPSNPPPPPGPQPYHEWYISSRDLHMSYHDGSKRWTGEHVRCLLRGGDYEVRGRFVHWYAERRGESPDIVWELAPDAVPPDPTKTISIVGVVWGRIDLFGTWHVLIQRAEFTVSSP